MTTIIPESDSIKKAIKWISDEKKYNPGKTNEQLINEAGIKFDLSPSEAEFLGRFLKENNGD